MADRDFSSSSSGSAEAAARRTLGGLCWMLTPAQGCRLGQEPQPSTPDCLHPYAALPAMPWSGHLNPHQHWAPAHRGWKQIFFSLRCNCWVSAVILRRFSLPKDSTSSCHNLSLLLGHRAPTLPSPSTWISPQQLRGCELLMVEDKDSYKKIFFPWRSSQWRQHSSESCSRTL